MQLTQKDIEELRGLEESFWRSETRYDLAHQERFFAPDCFEFGRSDEETAFTTAFEVEF